MTHNQKGRNTVEGRRKLTDESCLIGRYLRIRTGMYKPITVWSWVLSVILCASLNQIGGLCTQAKSSAVRPHKDTEKKFIDIYNGKDFQILKSNDVAFPRYRKTTV
ncbi:hypothetical protein ACOME3_004879 [Neoechinorhynchus agilis]